MSWGSAWPVETEAMAAALVEAMSELTLKEPEPQKESIMVEFKAASSVEVRSLGTRHVHFT